MTRQTHLPEEKLVEDPRDLLTSAEIRDVTAPSYWLGGRIIAFDWFLIIGLFVLAAAFPNPLTIVLAVILLGGRQLALGVIIHETGHRTLLPSARANDFCGRWLAGYWVFSDKAAYMKGHLRHHQDAGTLQDPDLPNYVDYPIPRVRLKRKVIRDLSGQIGWRRMKSIGRSIRDLAGNKTPLRPTIIRSLAVNVIMLTIMTLAGHPWLYLLWIAAFMTTHMLVTRVRQIAEHAAVPDHYVRDARQNTRTLHVSWVERLLIAPHQVSFHLEHHLLPSVPIYRLSRLHNLLLGRGFYEGVIFPRGYFNLLRQVTYPTRQNTPRNV
ncbi:MAG: fatty acid desaturase family protein [Proteobacteria bacterium]|jgi:fatty acid desaturase|nr:fatty acid desaturase family protein [Pseudomonadota bacterium]